MSKSQDKIMHAALFTPNNRNGMGLNLLFEGAPGTAKSARLARTAYRAGLHFIVIIPSLRDPTDLGGMPTIIDGCMALATPLFAQEAAAHQRAIIFVDEANTAPPAVQEAMLRMFNEGVVGEFQLPKTVRFVAAQNSVEEAAGGWDTAAPMANRFGHLPWDGGTADDWSNWLLSDGGAEDEAFGDAAAEEARVWAAWPIAWASARGVVSGFISKRPDLLHVQPDVGSPAASKAWPSRRTWEMATRALAGAEIHGLDDIERIAFVEAFIGKGAAAELLAYLLDADLPSPADVLDGKVQLTVEPRRLDRTVAILNACAALVSPEKADKRLPRADALWAIIADVCTTAADLAVPAARAMLSAKLYRPSARSAMLQLEPVLRKAGYNG